MVATARPAPDNKADAHVWRSSGLPEQCQGVTVPVSSQSSRLEDDVGTQL
nr:hypothetical protein [Streptomyces sp. NRRL S-646]